MSEDSRKKLLQARTYVHNALLSKNNKEATTHLRYALDNIIDVLLETSSPSCSNGETKNG